VRIRTSEQARRGHGHERGELEVDGVDFGVEREHSARDH